MSIAGLGTLSGVPLYSTLSKSASNLLSAQGASSAPNDTTIVDNTEPYSRAYPSDPNILNATDAEHAYLTLPPNTVESGQMSSTSGSYVASTSDNGSGSTDLYSAQGSATSASYDVSYNTPIATLQSLGFIQQGDVLVSSDITTMTQQSEQSAAQSETASQQTAASSGATQSSTATESTQQADSQQSVAVFYTQNWLTPNGQGFTFQELVRFNQSVDSSQAQGGVSTASTPPVNAVANAVANAPTTPAPPAVASTDADAASDNHAAAKSAAEVQLATLSTQVTNSVMNSWLQVSTGTNTGSGSAQANASSTTTSATTAGQTSATSSDQALLKQANSLLALFESLGNAGLSPGAGTPAASTGAQATTSTASTS